MTYMYDGFNYSWFNNRTGEFDAGPSEKTVAAYLPYVGDENAEAIFKIRVNDQGYQIDHAYIHVLRLMVGEDYPLTDAHKQQ